MARSITVMSVMEVIRHRRSVRDYSPRNLDRATVRTLLAAAVCAPTAVHEEPWAFVIVQDTNALKRISDRAKPLFAEEVHRAHLDRGGHALEIFRRPDFNIFYNASTLIVIGATTTGPFIAADCWLAAENLMLAAAAIKLGSCVIGSALPALNDGGVKKEIGIPADFTAVAPVIVGHPTGETPPTSRKEPEILVWK
ncbi:MAG TPA: nitroreductase family protein [Nitrospiria bacterium]|nr:nitroreductase family protein [Nitrospiria bacterium]